MPEFTRRTAPRFLHLPIAQDVSVAIIDADVVRVVTGGCSMVVAFNARLSIDRSGTQVRGALKRLVRHAWKQGGRWSGGHLTF